MTERQQSIKGTTCASATAATGGTLADCPLSDLLLREEQLQVALDHNGRMTDALLQRFYREFERLRTAKEQIYLQLRLVRERAQEKIRLAQLLQFPPELSRFAHLVTPSRESLADNSDPKLLVSFGSKQVDREVLVYIRALMEAKEKDLLSTSSSSSITGQVQPPPGAEELTSSNRPVAVMDVADAASGQYLKGGRTLNMACLSPPDPNCPAFATASAQLGSVVGLPPVYHPDNVSPYRQVSSADLIAWEREMEHLCTGVGATSNQPRLEKVTQPFLLAEQAYIPYVMALDEKEMDERVRNKTYRYMRRYQRAEWSGETLRRLGSSRESLGSSAGSSPPGETPPGATDQNSSNTSSMSGSPRSQLLTVRLRRTALSDFPVVKCRRAGRTLVSLRAHTPGELLFVDLALLTVSDEVKDLLLPSDLKTSYDKIVAKKDLFVKHPTWDKRLVLVVFAFISQQSNAAPPGRKERRALVGTTSTSPAINNFFEKAEVKRRLAALCCPLDDVEPALLNELYKFAQLIHASLPQCYQRSEEDGAEQGDSEGAAEKSSAATTLTIEEIVKLMMIFTCNSVMVATSATTTLGSATATPHPTSRSLFFMASMLQHSCVPNAVITHRHSMVDSETGAVEAVIRGLAPISIGERVSISYVSPYQPRAVACKKLRERYYFDCHCPRCDGEVPERIRGFLLSTDTANKPTEDSNDDEKEIVVVYPMGPGTNWKQEIAVSDSPSMIAAVGGGGEATPAAKQLPFLSYDAPTILRCVALENEMNAQATLGNEWNRLNDDSQCGDLSKKERLAAMIGAVEKESDRLAKLLMVSLQTLPWAPVGEGSQIEAMLSDFKKEFYHLASTTDQPKVSSSSAATPSAAPHVAHYSLVLPMYFLVRCVEVLLSGAREGDVGKASRIADIGGRTQVLLLAFLCCFAHALGIKRFPLNSSSSVNSPSSPGGTLEQSPSTVAFVPENSLLGEEMLQRHHFPLLANGWELAGALATRLASAANDVEADVRHDEAEQLGVAKESWEVVFYIYRSLLHWRDTSKCLRSQIFATEPYRYMDSSSPTAAKKGSHPIPHGSRQSSSTFAPPGTRYLPPQI